MSALSTSLHPDEKLKAGTLGKKMAGLGMGFGVALLVGSAILGSFEGDHWKRFMYAFLTAWTYAFSIAIGCLWFVLIHHLTRSRWSTVIRRVAEIVTGAIPVLGVFGLIFIIPLVAGYEDLYFWASKHAHDPQNPYQHHLHGKLGWLDPMFFAARYVFYVAFYSGVSWYFAKKSRQQDVDGDPKHSESMRIASGPGMLAFALVTILFGFDILMSLAPKWYSTIFSVNFWAGCMIGCYAFLTLLTLAIQRTGRLTHSITTEHFHDLGKWVFAFVFFWAYTAFSQFMLIWYANIPEETVFYKYRMFSEWQGVSIAVGIGQWAIPFLFLLSRWTKRIQWRLVAFCVWVLVFHWLDLYWNVMPNLDWKPLSHEGVTMIAGPLTGDPATHTIGFSPVDITTWLGMIAVLIGSVGMSMKGNLLPIKDPQLKTSLGFENY